MILARTSLTRFDNHARHSDGFLTGPVEVEDELHFYISAQTYTGEFLLNATTGDLSLYGVAV